MALSIPEGVSQILGGGLPASGFREIPLVIKAPNRFRSNRSVYLLAVTEGPGGGHDWIFHGHAGDGNGQIRSGGFNHPQGPPWLKDRTFLADIDIGPSGAFFPGHGTPQAGPKPQAMRAQGELAADPFLNSPASNRLQHWRWAADK